MIKNSFLKRITVTSRCIDCGTLGIHSWLTVCPITFRSQPQGLSCSSNPLGYWRMGVVGMPSFICLHMQIPQSSGYTFLFFKWQWLYTNSSTVMENALVTYDVYLQKGLVGRLWQRMSLTWSSQRHPSVLNGKESVLRRASFISNQIKIEGWRLTFNLLIL